MSADDPLEASRNAFADAIAEQMRKDGATDEQIAAGQARATGRVVATKLGDKRNARAVGLISTDATSEPATAKGLHRLELWLAGRTGGRPSQQAERIERIVDALRQLGPDATREDVAGYLGKADADGQLHGSFKRDVQAARGWEAIRRRAGF